MKKIIGKIIFIIAVIAVISSISALSYLLIYLVNSENTSFAFENDIPIREEEELKLFYSTTDNKIIEYNQTGTIDKKINVFSNCLYNPLEQNNFNSNLTNKIASLDNFFKNSSSNFAFYYQDITTGFTLSYNANQEIFSASVIKAPVVVYIYHLASLGEVNLETKLTYTSKYYRGGTGIIQNSNTNTSYTIRKLVEYSVRYSDNIAHAMLVDYFGMQNIKSYWDSLGATSIFANGALFSNMNAVDGAICMKELYKFYKEDNVYGTELMNYFISASFNLITSPNNYTIAHKYGWSGYALHDFAIVFDETPYILIVLTTKGNSSYSFFFKQMSNYVSEIHTLYNDNKQSYCINNLN